MGVNTKAQGLVKVSSAILDLVGSNQFSYVVTMRSGKQTHSEEQCRYWSSVYYTGGPKAEYPLSQVFVKTLYTLWRRKWQPTPVFLPGKSHGWKSLVGYSPWGRKESGHD